MKAWKFGDDVNTDLITPGRYTVTTDRSKLGKIVFLEHRPEFAIEVRPGDVIVAGENFGCGSSREHAPLAIKSAGVSAVIAKSFARIFFRNSVNIGLSVLTCKDVVRIDDQDLLQIDFGTGEIRDETKHLSSKADPLPDFARKIVESGGLINFLRIEGYI